MHPIRLAVLPCLLAFSLPVAETGAQEGYLTQSRVVEPNGFIRKKLEAPAKFEFDDTPLHEAMAAISDQYDFPIIFDGAALQEAGVPLDVPIILSLDGITLRSAFKVLLEPLGLVTSVEDELLVVTTWKRGENQRSTRFYEVQHLLDAGLSQDELVETWRRTGGSRRSTTCCSSPTRGTITPRWSGC